MTSSQLCVRKPQALSPHNYKQNKIPLILGSEHMQKSPLWLFDRTLTYWPDRHHHYVPIPPLCQRTLIGTARGANPNFFAARVINMTQELALYWEQTHSSLSPEQCLFPLGRGWDGYLHHTHAPIWQVQPLYTTINLVLILPGWVKTAAITHLNG